MSSKIHKNVLYLHIESVKKITAMRRTSAITLLLAAFCAISTPAAAQDKMTKIENTNWRLWFGDKHMESIVCRYLLPHSSFDLVAHKNVAVVPSGKDRR